jgi:hypothetical protein
MKTQLVLLSATIGIVASAQNAQAQHGHLNAGAVSTNQNAQLIWANGADFIATSGYVNTLSYTNGGRFDGYFQGNITLTALPQLPGNAGPDPAAAALGAYLQFSMACLDGPTGGTFGFWDVGSTNPSISLAPGQTSTKLWRLTESDGSPGTDPYGHIHGRRFSATQPGIYKVGFTALDTSTNGVGGGPIHTPSRELPVWFQAGVNIQSVEPDYEEGHVHVRFGATAGFSWQMEAINSLGTQADWQPAGTPFTGNDYLIELIHEGSPGELRFYRVKGTPVTP